MHRNLLVTIDRHQPDFWISGHTHYSMDMHRGRTRLISNPCGYPNDNTQFDPQMVIEDRPMNEIRASVHQIALDRVNLLGRLTDKSIPTNGSEGMSEEDITAPTTREASMPFPAVHPTASSQQPLSSDPALPGAMGPLELGAYKADWRASSRYRRHVAEVAAAREHELLVKRLEEEPLIAAEKAMHAAGKTSGGGFAVRKAAAAAARKQEQNEQDEDVEQLSLIVRRRPPPPSHPVTAARVAARLMFARLFDSRPGLHEAIRSSAPIVALDVPDPEMLERILATWQDILFTDTRRVMKVGTPNTGKRDDYDAVHIAVKELPKAKDKSEREKDALAALSLALPLIAISPASETHLPAAVLKAAPVRIVLPRLDPATIARAIRIVTGRPCRDLLDVATAGIAPVDLIVAIRFDRTPAGCLAELRRLAADKVVRKGGRDISLDELHGMDDAVAWARSTIRDLEAWRRGEIPWSALDPGACLVGPPGTGKTLFAECFSRAAKVPMVACSLAQWQGTDEGHLGHLLRAMKRDFDAARAHAPSPCVVFVDEVDSFADRSKLRHAYADYVVEVVNGFIAQLDGVAGREGLIFLAASNEISRCDPAILRSGRLNRIIRIGLPNVEALERMFRVRLAGQLNGEDLGEICLLALGSTGADVERITKDGARFARHENRPMELRDLRRTLVDVEDRDPAVIKRAAVHEAGHLLMELLLFGGEADAHATIVRSGNTGGATLRTRPPSLAGTYSDYQARLQVLLAGRTAEEIVFGEASHGAGGRRGSDLQQATALAAAMVASLGLAGPHRLLFLAPPEDTDELLSYADVRTTAYAELVKAAAACRSTLLSHRAALDEIAATLLQAGRIDGVTAAAIIGAHRETKEGE